ncbi:hypothetical protein [Shewanella woodyi]|uniref:hypothetical protein n=1 Tax=Shewanella woodyi TaxID=60961 RepID=UPI00374A5F93
MYLRSFLIFLVSAFLISCSTVYEVEIVPTEEAISRQEGMLKGIHIGQAKAEVDKLVTLPKYNSFDVKEGDNTYAFQQTTNNETNVGFGFYFENDKLSAVLSDDDTAKLSSCRSLFRTNAKHWLEYGIKPYADWIKARNSMSQDFNYREFRTRTEVRRNKLDTALGNPLTIVAYSPAIVLASPVIIHDQITGESEKKESRYKRNLIYQNQSRLVTRDSILRNN